MADYQLIDLEKRDRVAVLRLNRPPGNLLNIDLMDEVNDALLGLRADPHLDLLVLRGDARTLSEGLDLREHVKHRVQRLIQVCGRLFENAANDRRGLRGRDRGPRVGRRPRARARL